MRKLLLLVTLLVASACGEAASATCFEPPAAKVASLVEDEPVAAAQVKAQDPPEAFSAGTDGPGAWFMSVRMKDGTVATWVTGGPGEGVLTFPVGDEARSLSDVGVDAPEQATPDHPDAVRSRECLDEDRVGGAAE